LTVVLLAAPSLCAAENTSAYTDFKIETCKQIDPPDEQVDDGGSVLCDGHGGLKVYWAGGDLRDYLAYGADPEMHCSRWQTFNRFNSSSDKIEWRLKDGKPIAVIHRWSVAHGDEATPQTKSWLVVTKLEEHDSCRMAIVEGSLPDANLKAREAADTMATGFSCLSDTQKMITAPETDAAEIGGTFSCKDK
jgi:hypothetical protein